VIRDLYRFLRQSRWSQCRRFSLPGIGKTKPNLPAFTKGHSVFCLAAVGDACAEVASLGFLGASHFASRRWARMRLEGHFSTLCCAFGADR
jgi:hypothetical protein